jgi:Predicted integral membrane protein
MIMQSAILKMLARKALKGCWQTAMVVLFTAGIPVMAVQVYQAVIGKDLTAIAMTIMQQGDAIADIDISSYWSTALLPLIAALLSVGLNLGMQRYFINIIKGNAASYLTVFSRLSAFFKGLVVQLIIIIACLLCMAAVAGPFLLLVFAFPNFGYTGFARFLATVVPLAAMAFSLFVYFSFVLAEYALAEDGTLSALKAIKMSREWMKGHKKEFFFLQLSFIGWNLLSTFISTFLQTMFGGVIGMTLGMFLNLAVSVYITATVAVFYVVRSTGGINPVVIETPQE